MTHKPSLADLRAIADEVATLCNATDNGVAVTVEVSHAGGWRYTIRTLSKGAMQAHHLDPAHTSKQRLRAHVQGFIENYRSSK